MLKWATAFVVFGSILTACSGDSNAPVTDAPPKGQETRVVFSPIAGEMPIPNDLLFANQSPADGTMYAGNDPANPVLGGIDALDGASVLAPVDIKFSGSLDTSQSLDARSFVMQGSNLIPNPEQNVFLLPLTYPSGDPLVQAQADIDGDGTPEGVEAPTFREALAYQQAAASGDTATMANLARPTARAEIISLDGGTDNVLRISPIEPLAAETKYLVVLTDSLTDNAGFPVQPSHAYNFIRDPESPFDADDDTVDRLRNLRAAITGWEQLAEGYFGFMQSVYDSAGVSAEAPSADNIVFSMTFTTGGTDAVLTSIAAPEVYFEKRLQTQYKQDAISKLASGTYNLSADNSGLNSTTDAAINSTLHVLLTAPTLPNDKPNPLYRPSIANAVAGGAGYAALAQDALAAFLLQTAAAEAAIQVHNSGAAEAGDAAPFVSIAAEAAGMVLALAGNDPSQVAAMFGSPAPRQHQFFHRSTASAINPALTAPAQVFQGEITLPYYQETPLGGDVAALKTSHWQTKALGGGAVAPPTEQITYRYPFPEQKEEVTVPLLVTLPDAATLADFGISKPDAGWPVVIFVHGIGTDRSTSLPIANALAFACVQPDRSGPSDMPCYATIAIDQPLHGVAASGSRIPGLVSATHPTSALDSNIEGATPSEQLTERHFDYTADAQTNPVPMDYAAGTGTSGSLFINLSHFTNARSNLQQMVLDLLNLNASLGTMDVDGDGDGDLDSNRVYFVGHSLGAINGIPFVAVNNDPAVQASPFNNLATVKAAAFLNTGGGVTRLLVNSPSLAPSILQGLASASDDLAQGSSGLETYLNIFQGVLDSVDAMNFADNLAAPGTGTGVLLTEIVGDGSSGNPPDQTIPNAVDSLWGDNYGPLEMVLNNGFTIDQFAAPLAGTEPLVAQFNAVPTAQAEGGDSPAVLVSRFSEGSHGTPVVAGNTAADPDTSGAVFAEMVRQMVAFFALNGVVPGSIVTDASVMADSGEGE